MSPSGPLYLKTWSCLSCTVSPLFSLGWVAASISSNLYVGLLFFSLNGQARFAPHS